MAQFQLKDPQTGKTVTIQGNKAPDANATEQIFKDAGLRGQSKAGWLNPLLQIGGAWGGGALGAAGGALAGAAIPGADLTGIPEVAGGYAGGVAGAGAGSGAGNAAADWIRQNLLGDKTINSNQTLPNSIEAGKQGAIGEAIGVPFAKTIGIAAHPIASVMSGDVPFVQGVDNVLSKSGKMVDIGGLLSKYRGDVLPKMFQQGLSTDATNASTKLGVDMTNATKAFQTQPDALLNTAPSQNLLSKILNLNKAPTNDVFPAGQQFGINGAQKATQDAAGMNLPIQQANQLARNIQSSVKNFYGQATQEADIEARKAFGGLIKDAVHTAEPATKLPDAIAHGLYQAPDVVNGLLQILSAGKPGAAQALNTISSIPNAISKKVLPQGGGYLNQVIPRAIQLLLQQNQANQ